MKRRYIAMMALVGMLSSCKDNELFEKEMYKNVVALISSSYHNTFQEVVPLTGGETLGYIAASVGGTHLPESDLVIELAEDQEPLDAYNRSLFDLDEKLYAKLLPREKYKIEDYKIQIKAGERTGKTQVKLLVDGLSPDSTYFIALKASEVGAVEINEKKKTILYQIQIKNAYASQASDAFYTMAGSANDIVTAGNKKLYPLTKNSVRVVAGNESFENSEAAIAKTSMILEVGADNKVTIKPYKDLQIKQLEGDERYPNTYHLEESFGRKFHVFNLKYEYQVGETPIVMQEELRLEVTD
ncbi:MAG: BT_3044 domain-containing protein [Sphingobacterium hotanense]